MSTIESMAKKKPRPHGSFIPEFKAETDAGEREGLTSSEQAELAALRRSPRAVSTAATLALPAQIVCVEHIHNVLPPRPAPVSTPGLPAEE